MPKKSKEKNNKLTKQEIKIEKENVKKNTKSTASKSKSMKKSTTSKSMRKTNLSKSNSTTSNRKTKSSKTPAIITEYYDLPFRYNETVVKVLAQTPTTLFIYWDISNEDKQSYMQKYGLDFFNHTKPYLMITNETLNYHFEVEINDFANSWYLQVNDANCKYKIELVRKFIANSNHQPVTSNSDKVFEHYHMNDYISITSSNEIESPNNQILFDKLGNTAFFKNTKSNIIEEKNISTLSFMHKIGTVYNIYDLYKEIYHNEFISEEFGINLPSSSNSPTFK